MKKPKRAKKCVEIVDNMVELLRYYIGGTDTFRDLINKDIQYLEDYINELSEEKKLNNIKFATKLKSLWKRDLEAKDKKIKELEQEISSKRN